MRVSCAAFCRIEHEGRYLFILNDRRARAGNLVATPLGGVLAHSDPPILRQIDAEAEDGCARELRFRVNGPETEARLEAFRAWFNQRVEREVEPFREMKEELVDEQHILPALARWDVRSKLAGALEHRQNTDRPGTRGAETHYFWEVFDVDIVNPSVLHHLVSSNGRCGAFWLTLDEAESAATIRWRQVDVQVKLASLLRNGKRG